MKTMKNLTGYFLYTTIFVVELLLIAILIGTPSCNDPNVYIQEETRGCIDSQSDNYDPLAVINDGSCIKTDKTQNSIFVKFTATWCGPCGSYGMSTFSSKLSQHKGKVLGFTLQYNDALNTPHNNGLINEFLQHMPPPNGSLSTPSFGVNNQYYTQNIASFDAEINNMSSKTPNIGVGMNWTRGAGTNAGKINMNILGRWMTKTTGQYNITILVIGKQITAPQKIDDTYSADFIHKNVLLGSVTDGGLYGEPFYNGSTDVNQLTEWKKVIELAPEWNTNNIYFGIIIWKKSGNNWVFENCNIN